MVSDERLHVTKEIHRRTGRTFYYATRLLPRRVRHATYVLYAFFRIADEVVDDAGDTPPEAQRERLREIRDGALGHTGTDSAVLSAFADVRREHGIPADEIEAFVDAMLADVDTDEYATYEDLREYMRGSAAAVGVMMTYVMDPDDSERALPHARALGEAFQLTNFVRDVREDAVERGRVYLPVETLSAHGVTTDEVLALESSEGLRRAVEHELRRAERLYREGVAGIRYLPRDCQFPVLLAAVLYAEHHRLVREVDFDTLAHEPSLSTRRRLWLVAKTRWHWFRTRDPEQVFAAVSAVPSAVGEDGEIHGIDPVAAR